MRRVFLAACQPTQIFSDTRYVLNQNIITKLYEHNMNLHLFPKDKPEKYTA